MINWFKEAVSRNLRQPESTFFGKITKKVLEKTNAAAELEAVKLCDIKPDDKVLEIGFGPGIGLEAASKFIEGGNGKIYGADFSQEMVKVANERLRNQIQKGRVVTCEANVEKLPYDDNMFDKVFHVNCYYFWPDMTSATREIFRVMKPSSMIVTTLNEKSLKITNERDMMRYGNTDPDRYIEGLKVAGFKNIYLQNINNNGEQLKAIFAHVDSKSNYER